MYLKVFAKPSSRREKITLLKNGEVCIEVKEPAVGNHANKRIREIVADHVGVPLSHVQMISGHHSPRKMFSIRE